MAFQYQSIHYAEAFFCTELCASIAEQKHGTDFMGVGRGEAYLLRKCTEQFLKHFHNTRHYCIFAMCIYEALQSCLTGVSNVLLVGSKYYQADTIYI